MNYNELGKWTGTWNMRNDGGLFCFGCVCFLVGEGWWKHESAFGLFCREVRILSGDPISEYKYLKGDPKRMVPDSFQWWPETGWGAMAMNQTTRSSTSTSLHWGCRALEKLPGEVMEPPSLETFKTHLDMCSCVTCSWWPCLGTCVGLDELQTRWFLLWFC